MKAKPNFVIQEIAGEYLAIPIGIESTTFHGIVSLSKPAARLFQAMQDKPLSMEDMVSFLTERYLVDAKTATADLTLFIHNLIEMGLIEA